MTGTASEVTWPTFDLFLWSVYVCAIISLHGSYLHNFPSLIALSARFNLSEIWVSILSLIKPDLRCSRKFCGFHIPPHCRSKMLGWNSVLWKTPFLWVPTLFTVKGTICSMLDCFARNFGVRNSSTGWGRVSALCKCLTNQHIILSDVIFQLLSVSVQESICRNEVNSIAQYTGAHIGKEEVREGEEEGGREKRRKRGREGWMEKWMAAAVAKIFHLHTKEFLYRCRLSTY